VGPVYARNQGEELAVHYLQERLPQEARTAKRHEEILSENAPRSDVSGASLSNPVWSTVQALDPEGDFFESIVDDRIIEAIEALPEEYRTAVVLSDIEGLPYAEIADLMEVPVGTVKSRLFRGRRRLQEVLYDYAVEMGYISETAGEKVTK
jgi:RNA polymerase sigma factor (sigma-70 family)